MEQIYIGKIVNTFGIKGELKISSSFQYPEKAFIINNKIIINNKEYLITNVRFHKNNYLVQIDNIKDINEVLYLKDSLVYILRSELLLDDLYLYTDLIDLEVYDGDLLVGNVTDVYEGINPLIKVNNKFYLPIKANYIKKVDLINKKIICENIGGLML